MDWELSGQGVAGDGLQTMQSAERGKVEVQPFGHLSTDITCRIRCRTKLIVLCTGQPCIFNQAT